MEPGLVSFSGVSKFSFHLIVLVLLNSKSAYSPSEDMLLSPTVLAGGGMRRPAVGRTPGSRRLGLGALSGRGGRGLVGARRLSSRL